MEEAMSGTKGEGKVIEVAVSTTAGFFPPHGHGKVPAAEAVQQELARAAKELKLTNTADWVASVLNPDGTRREIVVTASYIDNHLTSPVEIDWGPREGGGG